MAENTDRGSWGSKAGFVLAAAGSAVGLGNIWKFPYITGENGGGAFVLIYLVCIALVGLPIMMAEIVLGRSTQKSPVGAMQALTRRGSPWVGVGWLGVLTAFVVLSYYSVVAGWALHYTWLSATGTLTNTKVDEIPALFGSVATDNTLQVGWHLGFMAMTILVVLGGIRGGIERMSRILMPALFVMLCILLVKATRTPGWSKALDFVFGSHTERLTSAGILEALGHAFFTLSVGMGAMLTYGSYLRRDANIFKNSVAICALDTVVALMACMILFPITFSYGMEPAGGRGLVFQNTPIALAQMGGGLWLALIFFGLVVFAALTSAISLLEVAASYFIDQRGWSRQRAVLGTGAAITLLGVPSALSGGTKLFGADIANLTSKNWFDSFDWAASNVMLPVGGLLIAVFTAWRMGSAVREAELSEHGMLTRIYFSWLVVLKFLVPVAVFLVLLHSLKFI